MPDLEGTMSVVEAVEAATAAATAPVAEALEGASARVSDAITPAAAAGVSHAGRRLVYALLIALSIGLVVAAIHFASHTDDDVR